MFKVKIPSTPIKHVVSSPFEKQHDSWLHKPLERVQSSKTYMALQLSHFFITLIASWLAIFSSLMIGAAFGDMTAVVPPQTGVYAMLVGMAHLAPLYIVFNLRTWKYYDVRINPYITLVEWLGHGAIGLWSCLIELIAQVLGATIASAWVFGVLNDSPAFKAGLGSGIINIGVGWGMTLEIIAGVFIGFVYFHNWYHDDTYRMPLSMACVVAGMTTLVTPYIGPTTHNPFRFWAACVIEDTCGARGWWVFVFGPGIGIVIGFVLHLLTQTVMPYPKAK